MIIVVERRTYNILFNKAPIDDVTIDEVLEAEKDVEKISIALQEVKKRVLLRIYGSSNGKS